MPYIQRALASGILQAAKGFPALLLTGPRQCGKTTLLRRLYPQASYVLLEDPDVISRVRSDPRAFMDGLQPPVILDEIQNAPELFDYVRARIDAAPGRKGQWLLAGSQEAPLMRGVTESMAGRVAVLHLLPLSTLESPKVGALRGGYPGVIARPSAAGTWFRSYVQTYLERDVRAVTAVRDLGTFRRFLALLASRTGGILNKTDLAAPLGVSVPTIATWLDALEVTGQVLRVPPFYENFGKRLIKSPKVYFVHSGAGDGTIHRATELRDRGLPDAGMAGAPGEHLRRRRPRAGARGVGSHRAGDAGRPAMTHRRRGACLQSQRRTRAR